MGGDQKAAIREGAARLFAERGYHATGIAEICEAVGLGRGALYHHIGSKEELLFEISSLGLDELFEVSEAIVAEPLSAAEKLRRLSRALMRNIAENRAALTVYFRELDLMSPEYRSRLVARRAGYQVLWENVLAEGVERGEFVEPDPVVVKGLLGMHNYSYLWLREGGRLTPEEVGDRFCDVILAGLES
ncbi:MAG: TetR family transcriptional regulator [Actinobacteria bacterium]|nr:TetR family transcriptional regulator [Actinomycetota bacterium]